MSSTVDLPLEESLDTLHVTAQLPQDIVERIVRESSNDAKTLAALCLVSQDCSRLARKYLYYVLDLIDGPSIHAFWSLKQKNRERRRRTMQSKQHLWEYIRCLAVTLDDAGYHGNGTNIRSIRVLKIVQLPRLEHIQIQFGHEGCSRENGHFRVVEPARQILEDLLSSAQLRSLSVDINTIYGSGNPFPGWIFRSLSPSAKAVSIRTAYSSNATIFPGGIGALSGFTPSGTKRYLTDFQLATSTAQNVMFTLEDEAEDSMSRCSTILSNLCFNLDFSQTRNLEITAIWNQAFIGKTGDETTWTFPNQAAETLEELTIHRFPNTTGQLGVRPKVDHFAKYRALKALSFSLNLRGQYPDGSDDGCGSLVDLLSLPLPSSFHRLFIRVNIGTFFEEFSPDVFHTLAKTNLSSWRKLDNALCEHSPMSLVSIELAWSSAMGYRYRSVQPGWEGEILGEPAPAPAPPPPPPTKRQLREARRARRREWEEGVQAMLHQWREIFQGAHGKGILSLKYSHTLIPPMDM